MKANTTFKGLEEVVLHNVREVSIEKLPLTSPTRKRVRIEVIDEEGEGCVINLLGVIFQDILVKGGQIGDKS